MYQCVRQFFSARDVLEVDTPILLQGAPWDPGVESWRARSPAGAGAYLHTSPEYPMKRLLAAGSGDIYQICRVFRGDEQGARHNPEFTLLEWYRLSFDQHQLMDEVVALVNAAVEALPSGPGLAGPAQRVAYPELFAAELGLDPLRCTPAECATVAHAHGIDMVGALDRDAWLDLLLSLVVAPRLPKDRLTWIHDYPLSQAILARPSSQRPDYAARFELYWGDLELANGFHELTDLSEYQRRQKQDQRTREARGQSVPDADQLFAAAMAAGLPDCSGVALGLDRLLMRLVGANEISAVLDFPWGRH